MLRRALGTAVVAALVGLPAFALADSITPSTFSATLAPGGSTTITKTITVTKQATTSKLDVFFLADTTGSMGGTISAVASGASTIMSGLAGFGDVQFAVGEYKDFGDVYAYRLNQGMTASTAATQTGINAWFASGGGDTPEAQLYGLTRLATDAATGWRAGSQRIAVWFGDAPGHDPSGGATLGSTIGTLTGNNIKVEAISVGFNQLNDFGQASAIATATGGNFYSGISTGTIVSTILSSITTSIANYSRVGLDLSGVPTGITATAGPDIVGTFDRSIDRTFDIPITFTGDTLGTYTFDVGALVDGGLVASERDNIVVSGDPSAVPEPSTFVLLGLGLAGFGFCRRKMRG